MPPRTTLHAYLKLTRFNRPIGAFLLLWPTLWALWLAGDGAPDARIVGIFIVGTFLMRAAGCVINDYADRRIDGAVVRTRERPLARGELSVRQAFFAFAVLLSGAFLLVLQLNFAAQIWAAIAVAIVVAYPFAKRVTHLPQLVLGVAFSWGIPMAYAAVGGEVPAQAWILFAANFAWVVAYDTQYAMADREDDLRIGVKSTAILFGDHDTKIIAALQIAALIILAAIGINRELSATFYLALAAAAAFAAYQQHLCKNRKPDQCLRAFKNNNWLGGVIFAGFVVGFAVA